MVRSLAATIRAANTALITEGDLAAIGEFFTKDYVAHVTGRDMKGLAAMRRFLRLIRGALPDVQVTVEVLLQAKDRVAWQRTLRGTHRADVEGFLHRPADRVERHVHQPLPRRAVRGGLGGDRSRRASVAGEAVST